MHGRDSAILGQKLGPYFVKDKLGQGGMGAVYLATDVALDRKVALKILLARYADDEEFVARFQREARASARLNHPNIVQIYTVDIESDPAYMAIEYIDGESLEQLIRRKGAVPWQFALSVVAQVASALACAHGAGIIHRDIKPANILIDKNDKARVTDFGIAKMIGSQTNLTGTQHTVGSPCYMSPEQCGKGPVTPSSDLFSLGIMLFEMLTGKVPFTADSSLAVMKRITEEDLPPVTNFVTGVPPAVQEFLNTLASRDPKFRYETAEQLLMDLQAFRSGNTMQHMQTLRLQQASQEPASPSAADLTRSPSGPSPVLKSSLVDDLFDDIPRKTAPANLGSSVEIPWMGIFVTAMVLLFATLGMIYYKEWESNRPAAGVGQAPTPTEPHETTQPPPPPRRLDGRPPRSAEGARSDPNDGIRPGYPPPPQRPPHLRPPAPGGRRAPQPQE